MQIRLRLTLQFIMIAAGILLVSFIYVHFQFRNNLRDEFFDNLKSKAYIIAEMVTGSTTQEQAMEKEVPVEASRLSNAYPENISIYKLDGTRIYTFNPAPDNMKPETLEYIKRVGEAKFENERNQAIGILYKNRANMSYVVVSESVFDTIHLDNLTDILLWVFLISITLVALGGWFFARQALSPVSLIMNEVDALLPTDMSHRLVTTNQRDELSRLVITFNKLLDRIQHVFRLQKMFLSNISHELKNPLNVITSQVEIALHKERSKEEYIATLSSVLYDVKELNDVVDKLMQLARVNFDGSAITFQPHRIDEMIWQSKSTLLKTHPEYKISFEVVNLPEQEQNLIVHADEPLFRTAIVNLMDNGCKFSPDKNVKVSLSFPQGEGATIEITDKGPGIRNEELHMVFEAFYRSPNTSAIKGSGIGLSLVESIVKLHRIDMKIVSKLDGGTTFILKFPQHLQNGQQIKSA